MAYILIVDDDKAIRFTLEKTLTRDGHQVHTADSGQAALAQIAAQEFDLALLDLKLKDMTGLQILDELHQLWPDTVAIILTGQASLETAVKALRQGAHDYLFKPCHTVELRESVRTGLLKRQTALAAKFHTINPEQPTSPDLPVSANAQPPAAPADPATPPSADRFVQRGNLIIDVMRHIITLDGLLLELSPTEFDLLAYLASEAPRVVSAPELVREVQNYNPEVWETTDTVRFHVYRLRQKIKTATGHADIIRNVRGVGYTLGL